MMEKKDGERMSSDKAEKVSLQAFSMEGDKNEVKLCMVTNWSLHGSG